MIKFIICDDYASYREMVSKVVNDFCLENDLEFSIECFDDYNEEFFKSIDSECNNIFIMDIEVPSMTGLDAARKIMANGFNSPIIFFSSHDMSIISHIMMMPGIFYVNKFDDYSTLLYKYFDKSVKFLKLQD